MRRLGCKVSGGGAYTAYTPPKRSSGEKGVAWSDVHGDENSYGNIQVLIQVSQVRQAWSICHSERKPSKCFRRLSDFT